MLFRKSVLVFSLFLCLFTLSVKAQQINYAEYFFDTDPGFGLGTPVGVATADSVNINLNISNTNLSLGFHTLYIRVRNNLGKWSFYQGRKFFIRPIENTNAPKLVAANFFIDTDPGFNGGTTINFAPTDSISSIATTPTSTLSNGFHKLYMRVKDSLGKWSLVRSADFDVDALAPVVPAKIAGAEYFYDTDPGVGNGIPVTTPVNDSIQMTTGLNVASVPGIFHSIYFRTKDSNGVWSHYVSGFLFKDMNLPKASPKIVAAEYFMSHDPGMGNAIAVPAFAAADNIDINCLVSTVGLGFSSDTLYLRVKDSMGIWSLAEPRIFKVVDPAGIDNVISGDLAVKITPNPAYEQAVLYLNTSKPTDVTLTITSPTGLKLWETSTEVGAPQTFPLDLRAYAAGTYFLEIKTGDNRMVRKFVKL